MDYLGLSAKPLYGSDEVLNTSRKEHDEPENGHLISTADLADTGVQMWPNSRSGDVWTQANGSLSARGRVVSIIVHCVMVHLHSTTPTL